MPNHQLLVTIIKRNLALDFLPQSTKAVGINPVSLTSVRKRCELMCKCLLERILQVTLLLPHFLIADGFLYVFRFIIILFQINDMHRKLPLRWRSEVTWTQKCGHFHMYWSCTPFVLWIQCSVHLHPTHPSLWSLSNLTSRARYLLFISYPLLFS